MNLGQLKSAFISAGARKVYAKTLAENDNSKNQVYFGPDFQALNLFPSKDIYSEGKSGHPIFKAELLFSWLLSDGTAVAAPGAKLILYPQYPEVRFSGFLQGCSMAPSALMAGRMQGRVLFLGVTGDKRILGYVAGPDSEIAAEYFSLGLSVSNGVFSELSLPKVPSETDSRHRLLEELHRIHDLGWIDSKQLHSSGRLLPCRSMHCGGFTLEAELGIPKNSAAVPDFLGWEVKQHAVPNFSRPDSGGAITLMTPEPKGGFYGEHKSEEFVRKYGYPDKMGRSDRINFGGIHSVGRRQSSTGLTMRLVGYDAENCKITDAEGAVELVSSKGEVAAAWHFAELLVHWSRKHMHAVYVPSMRQKIPRWQYSYGPQVRLAQGTDSLRFLAALATGAVYYDPGIKLEQASSAPKLKCRNQFRVSSKNIAALYYEVEVVAV